MESTEGQVRFGSRNRTKADIYVLPTRPPTLVKDYRKRGLFVRFYGRLCLNREEQALRRLAGLKGVPAFVARDGPYVLSMEFIEAVPIHDLRRAGPVPPGFVDRLEELLLAVEARGVAHGDPHMRNILCDREGQPYLVDFSTSYVRGRVPLLSAWVFRNLQVMRKLKVQKLRRKLCGENMEIDVRPGLIYRLVHWFGRARRKPRRR
ncbi:MAG: hypothetical protein FJ290_04660 [Planctomycetes bacterium]|nr:hypothetical protein [Planctomycetota bacterium]